MDSRGLDPGMKILPRLSRYWSLDYVGEVRKISLRDRDFYFSENYIIPYSTKRGVWIIHDNEKTEHILNDPDIQSRVISPAHAEL